MSPVEWPELIKKKIKAEALRLGFSLCGFTNAEPPSNFFRYETWLQHGCHGDMDYLNSERHREQRHDPTKLMSGVKTIVSLGWHYPLRKLDQIEKTDHFYTAGYVSDTDYHLFLPQKMQLLSQFIHNELGNIVEIKSYTDSAPILERELAVRAGLGWIGKNSCLISPEFGSALLLAEIFLDVDLIPDQPFTGEHCGNCRRCMDACPTQCIQSDRTIDSKKCISYLTIEHKGEIPSSLHPSIGNWLFGCDVCQMVCPWNQKNSINEPRASLKALSVEETIELLELDKAQFAARFRKSAIFRTKWKGLLRNALIVLGNSRDPLARAGIEVFADHDIDPDLGNIARAILNNFT